MADEDKYTPTGEKDDQVDEEEAAERIVCVRVEIMIFFLNFVDCIQLVGSGCEVGGV